MQIITINEALFHFTLFKKGSKVKGDVGKYCQVNFNYSLSLIRRKKHSKIKNINTKKKKQKQNKNQIKKKPKTNKSQKTKVIKKKGFLKIELEENASSVVYLFINTVKES